MKSNIFYFHKERPKYFNKHSKGFLQNIQKISKVKETKHLYDLGLLHHEKKLRVNEICEKYSAFKTAENMDPTQRRQQAQQLRG